MKKILPLLLCFAGSLSVSAQSFTGPFYSELSYPNFSSGAVFRPQHISCYSIGGAPMGGVSNNLYLHSWNGVAPYSGIAWRRNDPTNTTTYDFGYIMKAGTIYDMEVGLISTSFQTYVIATYWTNSGCFYDIYKWDATGLFASSMNNLISSTGRSIRMDSHKLYGIAVTWQDTDGIRVKVFNTSISNTLDIGPNRLITNTANCSKPDVAFAHAGSSDLSVRVAYVNPAGDIYVANKSFYTLLSSTFPSIMFNTDDISYGVNPAELDIDCPDHYTEDNWSYMYRQGNTMRARVKTVSTSATPFTITLSDASLSTAVSNFPTVAYSDDALSMHYGWYTRYTASPSPNYIAVERGANGSYITPLGWYKRIANTPDVAGQPLVTFSKQNDQSPSLFAAYAMYDYPTGSYELRTKLVPWSATTFRPGTTAIGETQAETIAVTLSPNPFQNDFSIAITGADPTTVYEVVLVDITGKQVSQLKGNLVAINTGLKGMGARIPSGIYFVNIYTGSLAKTMRIVKS